MDTSQLIGRLLTLMRQVGKQYTDIEAQELNNLYLESIAHDLPEGCTENLSRALQEERPGFKVPLMGKAVKALRVITSEKPPAPAVNSMEVDESMDVDETDEQEGDEQNNSGDEGANSKSHQAVTPPERPKRRARKEEEEHFPWVKGIKDKKGGTQLQPTQQKTELMRETLTGVYENWHTKDNMSWTQPLPDEHMKLITFKSGGRTCCLLRHVLLYMSIVYNVFVAWGHNLDRARRRRLLLMADAKDEKYEEGQALREELGVVLVSTNHDTTELGLLGDYEGPTDSRKNKDKDKKVLLVVLEGSTPEQIEKSPAVRCKPQGKSEVLSFKDYFDLLMRKLLPVQAAPKRVIPPDTESVPVAVSRTPPKEKKKEESGATKMQLKLPMDVLSITDNNLSRMVEYCETVLPRSMMEWFGNTVLDLQENRDAALLDKLELEKETPKHDSLFKVHKACKKRHGEVQCEHLLEGRVKCRHGRCDILECKRCPLLIRNYWYLMNLADTIDFKKEKENAKSLEDEADNKMDQTTCFVKDKKQSEADIHKVHKYKSTTKVTTVHKRLQSLRHFLEWYIVNVYDLLGRQVFNDSQPTLIGLFHSSQLPKLLARWHQSLEKVNRETGHDKLKDVIDVMECNVQYFQYWCLPATDTDDAIVLKLKKRFEGNMNALAAHMPKVAGAGTKVQRQTKARMSSTDEGKAPPIHRVFDAHKHLRTNLWDQLRVCRGKKDVHLLPQMILLLAFIKLLMGARAGMLSHMAIGKNLKTIGWVRDDDTVDHQNPNKEKGDDGKLDSYVKDYAIKYMKDISTRVPEEQKFELRYYVMLLALRKSWYGYKNGDINSRIVPFHREMSMELKVFAASILYIRTDTSEEVASLAAKFLEHWQTTGYDTTEAYKWLNENGKVDFLKLMNEQLEGPIRVFYKTAGEDKYGSHAIHPRGTSDTGTVEKYFSDGVTKLLKTAMRTYYASVKIEPDELSDGSGDLLQQASRYHHRASRSATADYISRLVPFMSEDIKDMLVEQTLMHTLETHNVVYIKDTKYMRCVALRSWMERGAPQAEWDNVERTTKLQMAVGQADKRLTFPTPPSDVQDICVLRDDKDEVHESSSASSAKPRKSRHAGLLGSDGVQQGRKRKQKASSHDQQDDDITQAPSSQRRRSEKLEPYRRSLYKDVGFADGRLVKIDCCTYKVLERKDPSERDPTGGYVFLVWVSCSSSTCKKLKEITLEDSTAVTYLNKLRFLSDDGEKEEPWAGERFSTPLT